MSRTRPSVIRSRRVSTVSAISALPFSQRHLLHTRSGSAVAGARHDDAGRRGYFSHALGAGREVVAGAMTVRSSTATLGPPDGTLVKHQVYDLAGACMTPPTRRVRSARRDEVTRHP